MLGAFMYASQTWGQGGSGHGLLRGGWSFSRGSCRYQGWQLFANLNSLDLVIDLSKVTIHTKVVTVRVGGIIAAEKLAGGATIGVMSGASAVSILIERNQTW